MKQVTVIISSVVVIILVLIGGYFWQRADRADSSGRALVTAAESKQVVIGPMDMAIGNVRAPVTIVEFASMTCPHCASFHNDTFKIFKKEFIDTGKVMFVFREFPLDGLAYTAAVVARCVDKSRFFTMLDVLFERQSVWARAEDPEAALRKLGKLGGLSDAALDACLADKNLSEFVFRNQKQATDDYGVRSTPSFVVNGVTYSSALGIEEFRKLIARHSK